MRIAYVVLLPHRTVGVERTLREKAAVLSRLSEGIDVIAVNRWRDGVEEGVRFIRFAPRLPSPLRYPLSVLSRYRLIEKSVDLAAYDAVILRYPGADPTGPSFTKRWPIITEHHTRLVPEMESFLSFELPRAERIMKRVRLFLERRYGERTVSGCRGIIAVTDEIRDYELGRAGRPVPAITVPNGIDVAAILQTGFAPFDGTNLHVAFVAGIDAPWNGIDRIVAGMRRYDGPVNVTLHLIGDVPESTATAVDTAHAKTVFHRRLTGDRLDEVLSRMTLAVSSMGLHRKTMTEACALKTREYTARGLPFVLGHKDPDLDAVPADAPFCLTQPTSDEPVDIGAVVRFAEEVSARGPGSVTRQMRHYAAEHMDWSGKLGNYVSFAHSIQTD